MIEAPEKCDCSGHPLAYDIGSYEMHAFHPPPAPDEVLVPPVAEDSDEMSMGCASWQLLSVSLHRAANLGFGIAVSGGRDNPHFTSGDPAVVISDVVQNGPAWGLLQVNDRILSANGVSFESIDYNSAVEIIKNAEQISMIVKRRVAMPIMEFEQRTLKFTLSKSRKKDDFGIVVGCKFYIKEIRNPKLAEKDPGLREGDSVLRINGQSVDGASLDEVNKWLERSRDKLCLVIQRDVRRGSSRWPSQNTVYERVGSVTATPRHSPSPMLVHQPLSNRSSHEYINSPRWRGEGSGSQTEERRVSSPAVSANGIGGGAGANGVAALLGEYEYYNRQQPKPDQNGVRAITFRKVGGSVGVRVIGGNEVGIFVSAVAGDSPAALHGVCCGDRILEVNGRSMRGVSREAAVQLLLALDDRVSLRLEHARHEFEHVRNNQLGDNFFIRAHFSKEKKSSPLELSVNEGDIFHITDTLFGGTVGLWQAARVYSANANKGEPPKGVIPNQSTAESISREQRRLNESKSRGTLLRRKLESRRTKSLPKNLLADPAELSASVPLPAYERVALNTPTFHRPLVLFGPLADMARQQLLNQFSMRFAEPESDGGVIRLSAVDAVIAAGKHCILDISMESVERLQLAQYAPIVVLLDVDGRSRIRELRKKANAPHLSSKKLAEQSSQIKKHHAHLLSATVDSTQEEGWFDALRDLVAHLQQRRLWMPEFPPSLPLEDVLLFPLSSKGTNYDSDMDSMKGGDYGDYSMRRDEASRPSPMARSIYDWDNSSPSGASPSDPSGHSQSEAFPPPNGGFRHPGHPTNHHHQQPGWVTLPRKPNNTSNNTHPTNNHIGGGVGGAPTIDAPSKPTRGHSPLDSGRPLPATIANGGFRLSSESQVSSTNPQPPPRTPNKDYNTTQSTATVIVTTPSMEQRTMMNCTSEPPTTPGGRQMTSPGYYHVKQLLNDDSLYHDARLANEIANVRLREEARIREERVRGEQRIQQLQNERQQLPLQPPNPDMYSPREERASVGYPYQSSGNAFGSLSHQSRADSLPVRQGSGSTRISQSAQPRPTIAPKPNSAYGDSTIRNKWNDAAATTPEPVSRVDSPSLAQSVSISVSQSQSHAMPPTQQLPYVNGNGNRPSPPNQTAPTVVSAKPENSPSPPRIENGIIGGVKENNNVKEENGNTAGDEQEEVKEEEPVVVEETSSIVGSDGGVLRCPVSGVELRIPKGAIADGEKHEIYVKVCREGDSPPIDREKGETLLSPLVMCGPQGLSFLTPCELRLPHSGAVDADGQWAFSLKAGEGGQWKHMELDSMATQSDQRFLSVPITHF